MSDLTNATAHVAVDESVAGARSKKSLETSDGPPPPLPASDFDMKEYDLDEAEQRIAAAGEAKYNRLSWKQLTLLLIVDAVALGALSIPHAFATLGMIAGVVCCVGIGLIAVYTSWIIGKVKLAFPSVQHYGDAGGLLMGRFGYEFVSAVFVIQLVFVVGSHCLTGTIAFANITESTICSLIFGVASMIILFLFTIPSSFADITFLGYIDFVSILGAIGITMIATGIQSSNAPGGLSAVPWSAYPKENITFTEAYVAIGDIVFAYSFAACQFSFMGEMHTPEDYTKSITVLGLIEIMIYTLTGAIIYAFVGPTVQSPALLSAGTTVSRIAFGVALPVIFISGSINCIVVGRLVHARVYKNSMIRYINTAQGWMTWILFVAIITVIAWVIAEAIPFFTDLLSIISALFTSGFSFYLPPVMWFFLLCKGKWYSRENLPTAIINFLVFLMGVAVLVCGLYSSIDDIRNSYRTGKVRSPFTCA
ncbi:N amino acid transport system protein [Penicillium diatomitis]|uniref:N amino acid transport system protein n=1 Tax=Penicillium diatomitis TaxID=2819901 RepID=A0A9X0BNS4_9EURO|nr:N amino acid transport system protein [Penicillium diatomitis]KAJ5477038.1 N amino acid transport system protein [Penicillium diatomitis]